MLKHKQARLICSLNTIQLTELLKRKQANKEQLRQGAREAKGGSQSISGQASERAPSGSYERSLAQFNAFTLSSLAYIYVTHLHLRSTLCVEDSSETHNSTVLSSASRVIRQILHCTIINAGKLHRQLAMSSHLWDRSTATVLVLQAMDEHGGS